MFKILIVDDDYITREGIIKAMPWGELGISQVEQAEDGEKALKVSVEFNPDIVLSDVRMPRMDGINFVNKLRDICPKCKIIFISGYYEKEYYKSAIKLKAISFLEKPIDIDEMKSTIENAVALCHEELEKKTTEIEINRTIQAGIPFLYKNLPLLLISPNLNTGIVSERLKMISLNIPLDSEFVTILIRVSSNSDGVDVLSDDQRENIIENLERIFLKEGWKGISSFKDNYHLIVHLYCSYDKRNTLSQKPLGEFCKTVYDFLSPSFIVHISVGQRVHNALNVFESYNTAVLALQKVFFYSNIPITFYCIDKSEPFIFNEQLLEDLYTYISDGKEQQSVLLVKKITYDFRNHNNTLVNYIKDIYYKLLLMIIKSAEDRGISINESEVSNEYLWESVTKCLSLNELEIMVIDRIKAYFKYLDKMSGINYTLSSIMKYIHMNYCDRNLSVQCISEYISLNSAYVCVLFKDGTGKTINKYITELRIEKAKELLKDKSLKVADIAQKVGYNEGDYLAKTFRKITGLSPSEYRERYLV